MQGNAHPPSCASICVYFVLKCVLFLLKEKTMQSPKRKCDKVVRGGKSGEGVGERT